MQRSRRPFLADAGVHRSGQQTLREQVEQLLLESADIQSGARGGVEVPDLRFDI